HAFSYVLGYSRRQYLRFVASQDMATTLREHVRAFEHLGGVAASCLYDNMKVVVTGYEDDVPIYNPRFLAFATHYGFRPVACRVRRPRTKGKVERPFWYVETSLFNGRTFDSLDHLNQTAAWWLEHIADVRELRGLGGTPAERHRDELPHLIPLPASAYEVAPMVYRTVGVEGTVSYGQNGYSVPWRYIGRVLPVRVGERELIIYDPGLAEIARHALLPNVARGQRVVHPEHRPREEARQRQAELEGRYAELGEPGRQFLEGLLRAQRYGKDQARRVLVLLGTYTRKDLIAALERAVRYGAYSHAAVERILSVQARPRTLLESLAEEERRLPPWLGEDPVSPRPTSDYQALGEPEPDADEDPKTIVGEVGGDGAVPEDP
ncbi:MAG: IS21 family transposase, partial [Singulisphaera sp.]|nr:IS21 family transposase [Singulisphaera sp.]